MRRKKLRAGLIATALAGSVLLSGCGETVTAIREGVVQTNNGEVCADEYGFCVTFEGRDFVTKKANANGGATYMAIDQQITVRPSQTMEQLNQETGNQVQFKNDPAKRVDSPVPILTVLHNNSIYILTAPLGDAAQADRFFNSLRFTS